MRALTVLALTFLTFPALADFSVMVGPVQVRGPGLVSDAPVQAILNGLNDVPKINLNSHFSQMLVGALDVSGYTTYLSFNGPDISKIPTPATIWAIGSLTKTFTATLLAYTAKRFGLVPTQSMTNLVQGPLGSARQGITWQELVTHHAGLPKNWALPIDTLSQLWSAFGAGDNYVHCDPANVKSCGCCDTGTPGYLALVNGSAPPWCTTGTIPSDPHCTARTIPVRSNLTNPAGWLYSNQGFDTLGYALAVALHQYTAGSGLLQIQTWAQAIAWFITQPLGLTDTQVPDSLTAEQWSRIANHCGQRLCVGSEVQPNCTGPYPTSCVADGDGIGDPSGGLFSTAADLIKFVKLNMFGACPAGADCTNLVGAVEQVHAHPFLAAVTSTPNEIQEWAWIVSPDGLITHKNGSAGGFFRSYLGYKAATHQAVVILANSGSFADDGALTDAGTAILALLH